MKTTLSMLYSLVFPCRETNVLKRLLGTAALTVTLLPTFDLRGATILFQATNTSIYLGLPAAQLELPRPLTGKEKVLDYKVLDWRDADYLPSSPPSYADWTVNPGTSYIDGSPSEIWMRQQGQWITTTTMVSSTVISIHMTGDNNDGVGEVLVDGTSVAKLNMYNYPLSQTALIIASNLNFGVHVVTVKDLGPMPGQTITDVHTFGAAALRATNSSPKWIQPPVAGETTNVFLGWNEASGGDYYPPLQIAADDWVCTNNHPITALRWWGSYPGWTGTNPPPNALALFNFCIWTDVPKQPVANSFSHPGQVIWQWNSANVSWKFVGWDYDPRSGTYDACFEYYQALPQAQWFYQDPLLGTNIYWLSIAAPLQIPGPVWGWKTVPRNTNAPSPDAAVRIFNPLNPVLGSPYVSGQEINYPTNGNPWDLAFELISSSSSTAAKWLQPPDLTPTGVDVNDTVGQPPYLLADDFQCTSSGPLTEIIVWGSWREDILPDNNPANVQFTLSIHQDIPAQGTAPSRPGAMLWMRPFPPGQFKVVVHRADILEWWMDPPGGAFFPGDRTCYQYTFTIPSAEAFVQQGTPQNPVIYWLDVQATVIAATSSAKFGWKTSIRNWNDAAVWANAVEPPPYQGPWNALVYPPQHPKQFQPIDLSFAVSSTTEATELKWSQPPLVYTPPNTYNGWNQNSAYGLTSLAADDWLCTSSKPVTDIHWWGSLQGWSDPYSPPPMPDAFRFSIWTDVPKQPGNPFSHPGTVILQAYSTNFNWVFAGWDVDPQNPTALPEACFKFDVDLDPPDWFYQDPGQHVYWISIAAIYNTGQLPAYPWGWKTRPRDANSPAPDAAVRITLPTAPTLGSIYQQGSAMEFPAGVSWDMAFTLTTVSLSNCVQVVCSTNITVKCASANGAIVSYYSYATNICTGQVLPVTCAPPSGSLFPVGTNQVWCTNVTAGFTNYCAFFVTVLTDTTGPLITCPSNIVANTDPSLCSKSNVTFVVTAVDDCDPAPVITCSPRSGSTFPKGVTTVKCTATDAAGNTNSCSFTVTIRDLELPSVNCPSNIVANTDPGQCSKSNVTFTATATDNCPGVTVSCLPPSGSMFQKGVTTVKCTATDAAGNTNSCSFTVTIRDLEPPSVNCPSNIVANTDPGQCSKSNVTFTATATDNCPGVTVSCLPPSGSMFPKGVTTVKCTATDAAGNTNSCSFTVTIRDLELPNVNCPSNIVANTDPGQCSKSNVTFTATATDNCPGVTVSCLPPSGSTFPKGA
ncbi:MAG: HYR domain-containing protein, partial [Verrucomicrobia bacterium]|nr:HYR domain-containing protein [Verrucomicrobiota bacterium]